MNKHRWAKPHRPDLNHTYRTCEKCGVIRVTRHEPGNFPKEHWSEWERDGLKLPAKPAPKCVVPCAEQANVPGGLMSLDPGTVPGQRPPGFGTKDYSRLGE